MKPQSQLLPLATLSTALKTFNAVIAAELIVWHFDIIKFKYGGLL